jgi:4'-phosphopantetheinyl transferase
MLGEASAVPQWSSPPETLMLDSDEVHIWRTSLDQAPIQIESFLSSLAADEKARAERFYFARDRGHFIVARGVLRAILARYLNRAAAQLSFCYGPQGKPALAGESGADAIQFNLSHSHGLALYVVTKGRQLGIDLERIRPEVAVSEIADRFFPPEESATLRALPADMQREAFFRSWTRKEASIKARGEGLSLPLKQIELPLPQDESHTAGNAQTAPVETARWSLLDLIPAPDYVAAIAAEGHGWRLRYWLWQESRQQSV